MINKTQKFYDFSFFRGSEIKDSIEKRKAFFDNYLEIKSALDQKNNSLSKKIKNCLLELIPKNDNFLLMDVLNKTREEDTNSILDKIVFKSVDFSKEEIEIEADLIYVNIVCASMERANILESDIKVLIKCWQTYMDLNISSNGNAVLLSFKWKKYQQTY